MTQTYQDFIEARSNRRITADMRAYEALAIRETEAETLIGELNSGVLYINIRNHKGTPTGAIKTGTRRELISYLIRNNYA